MFALAKSVSALAVPGERVELRSRQDYARAGFVFEVIDLVSGEAATVFVADEEILDAIDVKQLVARKLLELAARWHGVAAFLEAKNG